MTVNAKFKLKASQLTMFEFDIQDSRQRPSFLSILHLTDQPLSRSIARLKEDV